MKQLYTILVLLLITASTFAQAPERMSYQGVIRDSGDALVTNQVVGMQISILQGSASGTTVYTEIQTPTTNANGLATLEIGTGNTIDDFTTINWENGPYFIKTEIDPEGGTNYTITGTSQLLSVPYALYAKTAENGITTVQSDEITANSLKVGYTEALVSANTNVQANTAKVSYTDAAAVALNTAKSGNISTALSTGTVNTTSYGITSDGGANDLVLVEATTNTAGLLGADKWDEIVANTTKVGYTEALVSANTNVQANTAKVSYTDAAAVALNTAKLTNVPTALSTGTVNTTSYGITSDGGANDLVLVEATTNTAGLLGADKWDEIVANTTKVGYTEALVSANTDVAANTAKVGLPSQTGQSGKYLTTNGTSPSWSTVAGGSPTVRTISANTTLVNSDEIVIINGAFTATFPSAPTDGMKLILCTTTGTAAINGNGKSLYVALQVFSSLTFADASSNLYMFIYSSSIGGWIGTY